MLTMPRRRDFKRLVFVVLGWIFLLLGVAGLFLPVLQGILFLFVGVSLLSLGSPRVRLMRQRLGQRYPALRRGEEKARAWMKRQRRRMGRRQRDGNCGSERSGSIDP